MYQYAHILKKLFEVEGYDGILLGAPIVKGFSDRYLQIDAVLFAKNAIIIVDFKSHGGIITTPTSDERYWHDGWTADNGEEVVPVHGGSLYPNPFVQVQTYKKNLSKDILFNIPGAAGKFINTGIIFFGNHVNLDKVYIPGAMKSNFFIADGDLRSKDSYLVAIKSILNCEAHEKTVNLTDTELTKIREKFEVYEELTDEYIDSMTGISEEELAEKDAEIQRMQAKIEAKDSLLSEKRRELKKKDRELSRKEIELEDKTKTSNLLAEKNLELIRENEQNEKEREKLQQTIDELREQKDLSPEIAEKLNQMYYDVKMLKIRDYGQEIGAKWEQQLEDLKRELAEIKEQESSSNIYIVSESRPKWLIPLIISVACVLLIAIIGIIVRVATLQNPQADDIVTQISKPDNLEGPYNAYVYDGDTINIYDNGKARSVRLIGIDAPEVESDYRKAECFNKQAKSYISDKIYGNQVYLEYDDSQGNVDMYGRLLRYIWVNDEMLNLSMLIDGYAEEFTYDNTYKYKDIFDTAQAKAKNNGTGLWTTCAK